MTSEGARTLIFSAAVTLAVSPAAFGGTERRPIGPLQFSFETLGIDDGLESASITDLVQDATGRLWMGTHEGVASYDGESVTTFRRQNGLPSPFVFDLEIDGSGALWAATLRGLARFDGRAFEPVSLPGSPPGEAIEALGVDRDGRILAGAIGGVWRCHARPCERIFELPAGSFVSALARDPRSGTLWFAGDFGLVAWDGSELERHDENEGPGSGPIRALLVDRSGTLWVRRGAETFVRGGDGPAFGAIPGLPPVTDATRLFEDRRGTIWATSERGLFRLDGRNWVRYGSEEGLPSDAINAILEDFEGSLWLGTAFDGVARWRGRGQFTAWSTSTGLPGSVVWSIARTSDGNLSFGTNEGLAVADLAGGTLAVTRASELGGGSLLAIEPDERGGLWVGFEAAGLAYVDRAGRIQHLTRRSGLPSDLAVLSITTAPDGVLWLGTTRGLWRGRGLPETIRFERESVAGGPTPEGALPPAETFQDVRTGADGTLWAAGRYGLAHFSAGSWRRYTRADGLADDFVVSITETADRAIWVAYREPHGISEIRFEGAVPTVRHYDRRSGLAHDQATFVRTDALGRLWVGTTRGVSLRSGDRFASFDRRDGLRGDDLCVNSFRADADGTVWLGTTRGAVAVRLSETDLGPPPRPAARIRIAALGGIPMTAGENVTVGHLQNDFEVAFGAKTFLRAPRELEYRYQLTGVDREPVTTPNRTHTYGALPPGRYRFSLEARRRGGAWGPPAELGFTITPPWWSRAPAQVAALAAAALLGVLGDRLRSRRARRRQAELEQAVAVRTTELQASREELARINDELEQQAVTDPLTGLKNRRFAWELMAGEVARVDREWSGASPGAEPEARLVFFLMDLDLFKSINDQHGHEIGDQILVEAAERVRAATRLSDVVLRWGGEEFLVVARDLPPDEWASYAARLRKALAQPPYRPSADFGEISCTASLGYAAYPFDHAIGIRWQQVLHLADLALYAVKQCGRNADLGVEPGAGWSGSVPLDLLASQMSGILQLRWSSAPDRRA